METTQLWLYASIPVMSALVGWGTNVLALKMIFEPLRPRRVAGWTWQGMFLKRQEEVSEAYARLITGHIINTQNILREILHGPAADRLMAIIERHVSQAVDAYAGPNELIFDLVVGSDRHARIRERLTDRIVEAVPEDAVLAAADYAEEAMDLEQTMRSRLEALPPEEFVGLLRPIFQEDEWKLILVGAILGMAVGVFQLLVVFGDWP